VILRDGVDVKAHVTIRSTTVIRSIPLGLQSFDSVVGTTLQPLRRMMQLNAEEGIPVIAARPTMDYSGSLEIRGMTPGRYFVIPGQTREQYVMDVRQGNRSIIESGLIIGTETPDPIEVTFGIGTATIAGTIQNAQHEGGAFTRVVLVPSAPYRHNFSLYKTATADFKGRFVIPDVAPGDYKLFAWANIPEGAWTNADLMKEYETRGTAVGVKPNEDARDTLVTIIPAQ
jgi:hypothetical protein